jgi:hypothetical protein
MLIIMKRIFENKMLGDKKVFFTFALPISAYIFYTE